MTDVALSRDSPHDSGAEASSSERPRSATPVMRQDSLLPFELPAVARKKVSVAFDGGMLSSDAGVLLLRGVERQLGIAKRLAACLTDRRDPDRIDHPLVEMLRLRMFAIAAGYEDTNDCTKLRQDPVFKMAVGHTPESGEPLCSQPTMSRLGERAAADRDCADDGSDGGPVLRQLEASAALDHSRHRRHIRRGAWQAAALPV